MFAFWHPRWRKPHLRKDGPPNQSKSRILRNAGTVVMTAHGLLVGQHGLISAGHAPPVPPSPVWGWVKGFLAACVWAAMMSAGMLVYQHFVEKWQKKGLPILPVAALTAASGNSGKGGGAIPLSAGSGSAHPSPRKEGGSQLSWLDDYDG